MKPTEYSDVVERTKFIKHWINPCSYGNHIDSKHVAMACDAELMMIGFTRDEVLARTENKYTQACDALLVVMAEKGVQAA